MKKTTSLIFGLIVLLSVSCSEKKVTAVADGAFPTGKLTPVSQSYPDAWWIKINASTANPPIQSWEILPDTAEAKAGEKRTKVILSKRTELGIFSNFGKAPFILDGVEYASIEGLWQSMKYPEDAADVRNDPSVTWDYTRDEVRQMDGFDAKDAGKHAGKNMKILGIDWITYQGEKIEYKGKDQNRHYEIIFAATKAKIDQNPDVKDLLIKTGDLILLPDHDQGPNPLPSYQYYNILMDIRSSL